MNKTFMLFLLSILLISFASAEVQTLPPVVTGQCVNLPQQYANSTYQNITTIQLPDKNIMIINSPMTNLGGGSYNYTFCNTTLNGDYIVNGIGNIDGTPQTWNYNFNVNPFGKTFTNGQAILYFLIFTIVFLVFVGCISAGIYLPYGNEKDQMTGYIIAVSNMKYVKLFLLAISYLSLVLLSYFGWMISYGYLDMDFIGRISQFAFYALAYCTLPGFILFTYILIANWVRDNKIGEQLSMGLHIRE